MGILSRGAFLAFAFRDRSCASPYFIAVIAPVPEGIALASAFSLKSETVPISY